MQVNSKMSVVVTVANADLFQGNKQTLVRNGDVLAWSPALMLADPHSPVVSVSDDVGADDLIR